MFVGASGVGRVVQRTAELMREHDTDDVQAHGGIDLDTLQRYVNSHFSVSVDLFGSERSTNAANYYAAGLKGRFDEDRYDDDHVLTDTEDTHLAVEDGRFVQHALPARALVNHELRRQYVEDCAKGLRRWNRTLAGHGIDVELTLPHIGFHRQVGVFADVHVSPDGRLLSDAEWEAGVPRWLPTDAERAHVGSLMAPQHEPGKVAGWIAPPAQGVNAKPVGYEYVRL